LYEIF